MAAGTAIITVRTVDGNLTATCTVDVNAASELPRTAGQSAAAVWGAVMLLSRCIAVEKERELTNIQQHYQQDADCVCSQQVV